jgi:hypothetical protein
MSAGANDRLLLADERWMADATNASWPADRLAFAGWPTIDATSLPAPSVASLAIIADTCAIEAPEAVTEYSSHTLLWEKVQQVIRRDPFAVPDDPAEWVRKLASNANIDLRSHDVPVFVHALVLPAYAEAIADMLISADIPLRIYGSGWDALPRFSSHAAGPVASREELSAIAQGATALVHVWPSPSAHPIDALGRPVLRRTAQRREAFLRDARRMIDAGQISSSPAPASPALSAAVVLAGSVGTTAAR